MMSRISIAAALLLALTAGTALATPVTPDSPGWTLVRRVSDTSTTWHPVNDNLAGTAVYGTPTSDETADATFSIAFETAVAGWDQLLLMTGDREKWLVMERTQLAVTGGNVPIWLLSSHLDPAPNQVNIYNRPGSANPEDPWYSSRDHTFSGDSETHSMLYGESSYRGWFVWRRNHQGANVFVRNSTQIPEPTAAVLVLGGLAGLAVLRSRRRREVA